MASLKSGGADTHQHVERVIHLRLRDLVYRRAFVVLVQPYCLHQARLLRGRGYPSTVVPANGVLAIFSEGP